MLCEDAHTKPLAPFLTLVTLFCQLLWASSLPIGQTSVARQQQGYCTNPLLTMFDLGRFANIGNWSLLLQSMTKERQVLNTLRVLEIAIDKDNCPTLQKHTLALEAVERCITLFMILGNLHYFTPDKCPAHLEVITSQLLPYCLLNLHLFLLLHCL